MRAGMAAQAVLIGRIQPVPRPNILFFRILS
jgi:hypothetical protein